MNLAILLSVGLVAPMAPDLPVQTSGQGPIYIAQDEPSPLEDMEDTRSIIRGVVAEVLKSDKLIRINLGAKSPQQRFAAVIYPENFGMFQNVDGLEGRTVEIRGPVSEFGGRPQILLKSSKQLSFVAAPAPKFAAGEAKTTGEQKVIRGLVAEVLRSPGVIRIHLGAKFPDRRAAAVIYPDHFDQFPQLDKLIGNAVEISGAALDMPECPHVLLLAQTQITVLTAPAASPPDVVAPEITTGRQGAIRGQIAEILKSDKVIRVNLGAKAPNHRSSAVIDARYFAAFPDLDQLAGKTVEITGDLAEYGGREQVILRSTSQITTLETGRPRRP